MEIYNSQPATVKVPMPVGFTNPTVEVLKNGARISYGAPLAVATNSVSVKIPYAATVNDGTVDVSVKFYIDSDWMTKVETITVTTPYASIDEIRDALGADEMNFSDAELSRAERRIRGVINKYTDQQFGRYLGSKKVIGAGDNQLKLPERLVSIDTLSGVGVLPNPNFYAIRGDGWYLGYSTTPPTGDVIYTNPIHDPDSVWNNGGFKENFVYTISGVWGYEAVPTDVNEASLILIEDALCPDSEYRDRYLDNIRSADWRLEYSDRAFRGTGSVMADQLLESYRRWSMTVI